MTHKINQSPPTLCCNSRYLRVLLKLSLFSREEAIPTVLLVRDGNQSARKNPIITKKSKVPWRRSQAEHVQPLPLTVWQNLIITSRSAAARWERGLNKKKSYFNSNKINKEMFCVAHPPRPQPTLFLLIIYHANDSSNGKRKENKFCNILKPYPGRDKIEYQKVGVWKLAVHTITGRENRFI